MSVVAHDARGLELIGEVIAERKTVGMVDVYTERIARDAFSLEGATRTQYSALAGLLAFLYFSDSLILVLLGVAGVAFSAVVLERLVLGWTGNPYLVLFFAMGNGFFWAQFGLTPLQQLRYLIFSVAAIGVIALFSRRFAIEDGQPPQVA